MLSAGNRDRQFYTNFPPIGSIPSSMERPNGPTFQDVLDKVHGSRSNFEALSEKAGCFKQSSSSGGQVVLDTITGAQRAFTVEEKEVCLGFSQGYTAITALGAVEKRIQEFRDGDFFAGDYEKFGFVTLKGCVETDKDEDEDEEEEEEEEEEVGDSKRSALLGKSIDLHVLAYILKPLDAVFVPTTAGYERKLGGAKAANPLSVRPEGCVTLYVGNVPYAVTDENITKFCTDIGTETGVDMGVRNVRWLTRKDDGQFRGCGYVELFNEEAVTAIVAKNGSDFMGRPIRVDYAAGPNKGGW